MTTTQFQSNEVLLKVTNISKSFDIPVLHNINFEIKNIVRPGLTQGQIVSLVGKSGSGKSTLFNIMAGLLQPSTGTVQRMGLGDMIVDDKGSHREPVLVDVQEGDMGVVFQNSYIYEWRKVKAILDIPARRYHNIDIQDLFEKLDIHKLMDKYPHQLSGGQRQRVALAEQIMHGSNFILLDEPFSGLDTLTIDKVTKILTDIAAMDEYKTIIIISHDLSNSLAISDKAFILAKPEVLPEGYPDGAATITNEICLAEMGLAWQPGIKEDMRFRELLNQVKSLL